jgi:hypothetical protein
MGAKLIILDKLFIFQFDVSSIGIEVTYSILQSGYVCNNKPTFTNSND